MACTTQRNTRTLGALAALLAVLAGALILPGTARADKKLRVVATLPTYGAIAERIVGQRGTVQSLARGYEDPHFVRPKPSLAMILERADLLVSTGLDLELWLPALMDKANNPRIRSGQPGFVSVSKGISLLDKPKVLSRNEGGVHIYGNPHFYTGPLSGKIIARNITIGLKKVDPEGAAGYEERYHHFTEELDRRLFGEKLVKIMGSALLTKLALSDRLIPFLEQRKLRGKKLLSYLGGWMKQALPLRGRRIVTYHKNWSYFARTFGLEIVEHVEPKPGIPPSPSHVATVIRKMKKHRIRVLLSGNYYDTGKVKSIASRVGAVPVIVGLQVKGEPEIEGYFDQFDLWIRRLTEAFASAQGG